MIKPDFIQGPVGSGGYQLQFEEMAQPMSHGVLARQGFRLKPMVRGLIRYQDRIHKYRVGMLCGGAGWFLLDPDGMPLDRDGQPKAMLFSSARDAMNVAAEHAGSLRSSPGISAATRTVSSDRTGAPGYNKKIGNFRDVA